jgi:subtilisin family serine protease
MSPVVPGSSLWRANLANFSLSVLPDLLYQAAGVGEPDLIYGIDDSFSWNHLVNQQWALPMISAPNVPKNIRKSGDKGTIVAVIDTGIRYTHKDLQQNMWINPDPNALDRYGINAVAATNDPMDDCGHGTHCAGIIGATGIGMEGIAPQVQLMACKFLDTHGQGQLSDEIVCLRYAIDHGATVLNCSYGKAFSFSKDGFSVSMPFSLFSQAEYDTMKYVGEKGGVITIAAGNNSSSNDTFPLYPASYSVAQSYIAKLKEDTLWGKKWHEPIIRTAAALDNIVSVAATDEQDQLSPFSNYGAESVSIAAPGSNILSTWGSSDTSYVLLSGTSMAAPHVAGALALMHAQFPERSSQELIAHLLETADATPSLKGKTRSGRLNLLKALRWDE